MEGEKFTNTSMSIKALLGLIAANDIAIPEIQRPFVWKKAQVRDLMDSLYKGYPSELIVLSVSSEIYPPPLTKYSIFDPNKLLNTNFALDFALAILV